MALTPHLSSLNILFLNFAINGFASGGIESSADVWIVEMWAQECGPYVQALHFVFGVGSIVTPLAVEPFLSEVHPMVNYTTDEILVIGLKNESEVNLTVQWMSGSDDFRSRVYIPYSFLAIIIAICGLLLGSLYFYKEYIPPKRTSDRKTGIESKKELSFWAKINDTFVGQLMPNKQILIMTVLSGHLMSVFLSLEWSQFNYFPSFAHFSDLHLSEKKAAIISTGMAVAFTAGRALSIPLSHYLSPKLMIYSGLVLLLASELLFLILSNSSETWMWIADIVFGLGLSPIYASIYHMVEEVTPVTTLMGVLFIFMSGLTSALTPIIVGIYIESKPLTLVYINLFSVLLSIVLMVAIHVIIRRYVTKGNVKTSAVMNTGAEDPETETRF